MKTVRIALAMLLAGGLLFASPGAPDRRGPIGLIKILKGPGYSATRVARLQIDVRQELATCLLALADRADLALLRRSGVRFTVVDRSVGRREILLVGTSAPGALNSLKAAGRAVAVEPGAAVFWTEAGDPAEAVPSGLPRKALAARSITPSLGPGPRGDSPAPAASLQDPFIETLVGLVTTPGLNATVQALQDFQTRYASTTNCESAGEALFSTFSALGLDDVRFEPFTFAGSYSSRNVVAEKTGETYPDDVYILCAHYDTISPSATRQTLAPGADDNASGVAAVVEAARVLAPYDLDFTVRFIAFSAEEWGLYGSRAYAAAVQGSSQRIRGVINLDMIAYANAMPEDLQIIVNPPSSWLGDLFLAAAAYGPVDATKTVNASFVYSDHSPFWDYGKPALLAIEDNPLANPYYHQTTDTLDKLQPEFFTAAARASLGLLAELAQPIKSGYPKTPVGVNGLWVNHRSLFNTLAAVQLSWTDQSDAAGYNVYRTTASHLGYVKINGMPVEGTSFFDDGVTAGGSYFYVVTAVGTTGLESNRSDEIRPADVALVSTAAVRSPGPAVSAEAR
jgi:hypothetical protein